MNKQAVIVTGGKQYLVKERQIVVVDKLEGKPKDKIDLTSVLLRQEAGIINLGTPFIAKAKVTAEILKQDQGKKIRVARFKAKSKYHRVKGFRSQLTQIKILNIS